MNRSFTALYVLALAAGLAGITGAALAAAGHHPVALAMTLVIAAFFALGIWELSAFRRASHALRKALDLAPQEGWLDTLPAPLRAGVQQRLEGSRIALPGLALAPAIAGLLVLLGMLGTFIGLGVTLGSTANALAATADIAALRTALGAPVQGLGLAFSASVAGVAGSAMLGLMVALARRERGAVAAQLDAALLGRLRPLTAAHRSAIEQEAAKAAESDLAQHRQVALVSQLQQFAQQMADQLAAQNARSDEARKAEEVRFHGETRAAYQALADSVDTTLRASLAESARLAGAALQPAAEAAMAGIAREAASLHERVGAQVAGQLGALSARFEAGVAQMARHAEAAAVAQTAGLAGQRAAAQQAAADAAEHSAAQTRMLLDGVAEVQARQQAAQAEQDTQRHAETQAQADAWAQHVTTYQGLLAAHAEQSHNAMTALTTALAARAHDAVAALAESHQQLQSAHAAQDTERLATWQAALQATGAAQVAHQRQLGDGLLAHTRELVAQGQAHAHAALSEAGALLQAAGEAPRAAVEVVAAMREQLAQSQAQDRAALAERAELMHTVSTLLASLQQAAGEQRTAIDTLVSGSATQLEALGQRFSVQADATGHTLAEAATTLAASAAEMGSLGEGFGAAVEQFQSANAQLVQHLALLEERLSGVMTRSDEQLGYYVAQAREVIDLCLGSQKQVLDALQGAAAHG